VTLNQKKKLFFFPNFIIRSDPKNMEGETCCKQEEATFRTVASFIRKFPTLSSGTQSHPLYPTFHQERADTIPRSSDLHAWIALNHRSNSSGRTKGARVRPTAAQHKKHFNSIARAAAEQTCNRGKERRGELVRRWVALRLRAGGRAGERAG